jgi:hypothetical protein
MYWYHIYTTVDLDGFLRAIWVPWEVLTKLNISTLVWLSRIWPGDAKYIQIFFLLFFQSLLDEPNPNSPANNVAAQLYKDNVREYEKRVKVIVEDSWIFHGLIEDDWNLFFIVLIMNLISQSNMSTMRSPYQAKHINSSMIIKDLARWRLHHACCLVT